MNDNAHNIEKYYYSMIHYTILNDIYLSVIHQYYLYM